MADQLDDEIGRAAMGVPSAGGGALSDELKTRLARLEELSEKLGQFDKLSQELTAYVMDCRDEIVLIRMIRYWALAAAGVFLFVVIVSFVHLLFFQPIYISVFVSPYKVYLVIALLLSFVVVISVVLKGAFRTISDRHADDGLPPNVKEMVDAAKSAASAVKGI